jgi:hypothetical protein
MSVRFIPDEWTTGQDGREPAQHHDLMMALQSIEFLLIFKSENQFTLFKIQLLNKAHLRFTFLDHS